MFKHVNDVKDEHLEMHVIAVRCMENVSNMKPVQNCTGFIFCTFSCVFLCCAPLTPCK